MSKYQFTKYFQIKIGVQVDEDVSCPLGNSNTVSIVICYGISCTQLYDNYVVINNRCSFHVHM